MAQLDFFGTWKDAREFLARLFEDDLEVMVIPDSWYEAPSCRIYTDFSQELEKTLEQRRKFYILRKGQEIQQSGFRLQRRGPRAGMYSIDSALLAPSLECTLPALFENEGETYIALASLWYRQEYYDERAQIWYKPTKDLKLLFTKVGTIIKKGCIRRRMITTEQWCGYDAAHLLDEGRARIAAKGV